MVRPTKELRCFFILEAVENPLVSVEAIERLRYKPSPEDIERWHKLYLESRNRDSRV